MTSRNSRVAAKTDFHTLQRLIWPEQGICTEYDMYFRLKGLAAMHDIDNTVHMQRTGAVMFNTYFNLFNIGQWHKRCALDDIHLEIQGTGTMEVRVFLALPGKSWERLANRLITPTKTKPARIDLSHFADRGGEGVLFFELHAQTDAVLTGAEWQTAQSPQRTPDLALSITTFKREAAVQKSVARFQDYVKTSAIKDHLHLIVVDNGQTAGIKASKYVTPVLNENLGGSGGFARGLLEARDRGASHCLFMDDDAAVHMQSYERTWVFLAYATDPKTAVAGAMTIAAHKWGLWENGAIFDSHCKPQHLGTDLRDMEQVFDLEFATLADVPHNFYGGWWYFAFPVEYATHMPFPFFVRGDDVSFGLVHDFNSVTLNGVVSFQDEDFSNKESLQTLYLDMRSHMAHHLALPSMDIGRARTLRIALWFFARSFLPCHYETLSALNLSFKDVMRGPDFFDEHADMATRRAEIGAMRKAEAWAPLSGTPPPDKIRFNPQKRLPRTLMKLTLNGHLLPFFKYYGNRITLPAKERGNIRLTWGAAQITFVDATGKNAYTVTHSKARAFAELRKFITTSLAFWREYDALKALWQDGYTRLTTTEFWERKFKRAA